VSGQLYVPAALPVEPTAQEAPCLQCLSGHFREEKYLFTLSGTERRIVYSVGYFLSSLGDVSIYR